MLIRWGMFPPPHLKSVGPNEACPVESDPVRRSKLPDHLCHPLILEDLAAPAGLVLPVHLVLLVHLVDLADLAVPANPERRLVPLLQFGPERLEGPVVRHRLLSPEVPAIRHRLSVPEDLALQHRLSVPEVLALRCHLWVLVVRDHRLNPAVLARRVVPADQPVPADPARRRS